MVETDKQPHDRAEGVIVDGAPDGDKLFVGQDALARNIPRGRPHSVGRRMGEIAGHAPTEQGAAMRRRGVVALCGESILPPLRSYRSRGRDRRREADNRGPNFVYFSNQLVELGPSRRIIGFLFFAL